MRKLITVLIFSGLVSPAAAVAGSWDPIDSETGNHCKDQALNFLRTHFGDEVEIFKYNKVSSPGKGSSYFHYYLDTNLCEGSIVAAFMKKASCKTPHYGHVPKYIRMVYARGDCKNLIPGTLYPRPEEVQ